MGLTRPELRSERRTCCWRSWLANELPRCRRWLQRSRPTRIAGYAEINTPLVIQGGPGTGKTIVGLHRAAYLLYQLRRQGQESSVLVIGPNPAFMEYIGSVLPSLGESTATQLSLEDLPLAHLTAKEKPLVRTRATVAPAVAQLLGDLRMAAAVEERYGRASRLRHCASDSGGTFCAWTWPRSLKFWSILWEGASPILRRAVG